MKKQFFLLVVPVVVLLNPAHCLFADSSHLQDVVTGFIQSIRKDDTPAILEFGDLQSIGNQPRHSYTFKQLKTILAPIDLFSLQFSRPMYDKSSQTWMIRLLGTVSIDFELKEVINPTTGQTRFVITALHP